MSNPCNAVTIAGFIIEAPKFVRNKKGTEFRAMFIVSARRNYKNRKGEYETDPIPVRYDGEPKMSFAHKLKAGDPVIISGCLKLEPYKDENGIDKYPLFVAADSVSWSPGAQPKKDDEPDKNARTQGTQTGFMVENADGNTTDGQDDPEYLDYGIILPNIG